MLHVVTSSNANQCSSNPSDCVWDDKGTNAANDDECVDAPNNEPVANVDSSTTDEDTAVTITVLSNDTDLDGDTLEVTATSNGPANGNVNINANDTITYVPDSNWNGTDTFEYSISDGNGGTASAIVTVTVNDVNDDPIANAGTPQTVTSGIPINLDGSNSTDIDGTISTYTWSDDISPWTGSGATLTISGGLLAVGTHNITLEITDNDGGTATDSVIITVTAAGINIPPTANAGVDQSINDGDPVTLNGSGNDIDGSIVSYSWSNGINTQNQTINGLAVGSHTFILTVTDDAGAIGTDAVVITVTSGNTPPIANDKNYTTAFETAFSGNVLTDAPADSDPDGDTILVDSNTSPSYGTLTLTSDGSFTYTPNNGYEGSDSFDYTISDGNGGLATATVTITIEAYGGIPFYQNEYSCGVFGSVLTTYDHLYANGNNEQVCGSGSIAYPSGQISGDIDCDADALCGGTAVSCDRNDPPANRYSRNFPVNSKSGTIDNSSGTLTNLEYGDLIGGNFHFDPQTEYEDSSIKVMLLGDVVVTSSELRFEPGDYYFDSLRIESNNNDVILPNGGPVRIFVKGDFDIDMNNLHFNSTGNENNLFVYVNGDYSSIGNGGGTTNWKAYLYVEGDVLLNNNSNNWKIYGGITAEGSITINGNNPDFLKTGDGSGVGLGECVLCFEKPLYTSNGSLTEVETTFINSGGVLVTDLNITKAYSTNFTGASSYIDNASASSAYDGAIIIDFTDLPNFSNPSTKEGFVYQIGDYTATQTDTIYDTTNIDFILQDYNTSTRADLKAIFVGDYYDGDRFYHVMIERCGPWPEYLSYLTGPFDAWDIYRGDTDQDAENLIDDKNISTKIANKTFDLTIANLDSNGTKLETKPNAMTVQYGLYSPTQGLISGTVGSFEANTTSSKTQSFTVPSAFTEVYVGFRFCSAYDGSIYTLYDDIDCTSTAIACDSTSSIPKWRTCYSSDGFATRPKEFSITPPAAEDIELLKSGMGHDFTVAALDENNAYTDDYNQTKSNLDLNQTLILKNGTVDDPLNPLLLGTLGFTGSEFTFDDGISLFNGSNEVVGMTFNDVGIVTIGLEDRIWASIDSDDTPLDCAGGTFNNGLVDLTVPEGAYVCGEQNATFIPDHFELEYLRLSNNRLNRPFTYITANDDLNMSATIEVKIVAKNANGETTQNFKGGSSTIYYENPMTVDLTVPTKDSNDEIIDNEKGTALEIVKHDINTSTYLGFTDGNRSIAWNDSNVTHRIMFNYNKELNNPTNPFDLNMSSLTNSDQAVAINVSSRYPESGLTTDGNYATITGEDNATGNARFYYARTRSSKYLYDDVIASSVLTPIFIDVYCDLGFTACDTFDIDTVNGQINDVNWWLSWDHSKSQGDGNITLTATSNGTVSGPPKPNIDASGGADKTVTVTHTGSTLPDIVDIDFITDDSVANYTNPWLIYNEDSAIGAPSPFYKVRFIGTSDWAGHGDTGHVVGGNTNTKKNRRLGW